MTPLMFVNTSVLVTASEKNMPNRSTGAAADDSGWLNSRSSRYHAIRSAMVLPRMNRYRDVVGSKNAIGDISSDPPGGYR